MAGGYRRFNYVQGGGAFGINIKGERRLLLHLLGDYKHEAINSQKQSFSSSFEFALIPQLSMALSRAVIFYLQRSFYALFLATRWCKNCLTVNTVSLRKIVSGCVQSVR